MSTFLSQFFRGPRLSRDTALTYVMAATLVGLLGYIAYAEGVRASRKRPPDEYLPPVHPVSLVGAELKGNNSARVAVLVLSDFICPACGRFALETLPRLEERYLAQNKVKVALRHAPVGRLHSLAPKAAEAAYCAGEQGKFWDMHDAIFGAQLDREYGRTESASFDRDIRQFATRLGLDAPRWESCLVSEAAAERVYLDAGATLVLGVEATPSILVGTIDSTQRLRVSRHFRGRPAETVLFAAIDALLDGGTASQPRGSFLVDGIGVQAVIQKRREYAEATNQERALPGGSHRGLFREP